MNLGNPPIGAIRKSELLGILLALYRARPDLAEALLLVATGAGICDHLVLAVRRLPPPLVVEGELTGAGGGNP